MTSSPLITSVLLHLVIIAAICSVNGRSAPPALPQLYVELAAAPPVPRPEAPASPQRPEPRQRDPEKGEQEPESAAVEQEEAAPALSPVPAPVSLQAPPAPEISQAFAGASRMQEMIRKTRRYYQVAGIAVRKILEGKLSSEGRLQFEGESAQILASYGDGAAPEFSVVSENPELHNLLDDNASWSRIPSPRECLLPYKKVAFLISLKNGAIQVGLSPL